MIESFAGFFQDGGPFMVVIAVVLLIGLIVSVERWLYLTTQKHVNRRDFRKLHEMLHRKDLKGALNYARDSGSAMATMIGAGLLRMARKQPREDIEYAMEEGLLEVMPRLEKRTQYLATLANVATLLGLLGTIFGLIDAFTALGGEEAAGNRQAMLSSSISLAMSTTAFGLIAAIPLLLIHALLQTKTNEIVDSFEMAGIKVLNLISDANNPAAAPVSAPPRSPQPNTAGSRSS
ncbi:MotA/TolQ/ExbB proton channel family protein [Marinobacter zhanjiangensis]|uniref:TolQ-type transporter n=1 Tax=Marinobacter zhanjiangensis TaxID=578215 RepID=A0ABQ3BB25_9GAMM|nr:MotA/TolQ/ExbB proton channel family protein [Marinobacter zhanjiangensis]GGY85826.1 tolQ-type transporter [Marinobacter zhanjiangensis]